MFWRRRRDILTVLAFFGFINMSILRINLSIAILAMTSKYPVITNNGTTIYVQDFDFNPQTKGFILSAFFYGYMVTQIPGGWLATRMGGHKLYGAGIGVTALFTVLTPFIAQVHIYFLIATRVIEGLCEGFTNSSIEYIWAQWVPPLERNRLMGFAFIGTPLGTVTAMSMSGIIATYLGWQAVFFITGSFALVWTLAWWIIVYDEPENDPRITLEELTHIRNCLGKRSNLKKRQEIVFPWCKMLTSLPIWAGVTVIFVMTWNYHTLGTQMPTFLSDVLGFDIKKAGLFSSMPYLVMAIYAPFACSAADWILEKQLLSVTNSLYHISSVNHLDLAPPYASLLTGLAHTMSSVSGILATTLNGYVVRNKSSEEWTVLFSISGGICFFGAIFYGVFGSGELQGSEGQNGTLNCETLLHDVEILNPLGYAFSRRASELSFVERRRSRASEQSAEKDFCVLGCWLLPAPTNPNLPHAPNTLPLNSPFSVLSQKQQHISRVV
uniref:Major facilitator superfamily (MFS) profile domain-containing protein n=1 Tax=Timema shepardi TaxID=629360 RepID=A0A7R9ANI5_TIMSH|nr:unnamed protein product [Timema shepardi]